MAQCEVCWGAAVAEPTTFFELGSRHMLCFACSEDISCELFCHPAFLRYLVLRDTWSVLESVVKFACSCEPPDELHTKIAAQIEASTTARYECAKLLREVTAAAIRARQADQAARTTAVQ